MVNNNIEKIQEAKKDQIQNRFKNMQEAEKKAMEIDIERILKQSDIVLTINWLLLVSASILISEKRLSVILFIIFVILLFIQSIKLRKNRNNISIKMKEYFIKNSNIIKKHYNRIIKVKITELKDFENVQSIISNNQEDLDIISKDNFTKINDLIHKQELWNLVTILNFLILLILIFLKYNIYKIICW